MQVVFLHLTHQGKPILINAFNIVDISPAKEGGSILTYDGDSGSRTVKESLTDIAAALAGQDLLRRPVANGV